MGGSQAAPRDLQGQVIFQVPQIPFCSLCDEEGAVFVVLKGSTM